MGRAPRLNLSDHDIALAGSLLTDFLRRFEQSIPAQAVFPALDQGVLAELLATPFPEEGIGVEQLFHCINEKIVPNSTVIAHPRFLAYVLGPSNGPAHR